MNPSDARSRPFFVVRFYRWLFSWRTLRRMLIAFACFVTLIALVLAEENWRGKRAWDKFRLEWEAKGERFDLKSLTPTPVPDDQNFAASPIWKENGPVITIYKTNNYPKDTSGSWMNGVKIKLEDWQAYYREPNPDGSFEFPVAAQPQTPAEDVLFALSRNETGLQMLREASGRPSCCFSSDWISASNLDHLTKMKGCGSVLRLHAVTQLDLNRPGEALEDILVSLRLVDALRSKPVLISDMVRHALATTTLQPVWEGLLDHKWSDQQLATLDRELEKVDFLSDYQHAMRGEMAFNLLWLEYMRQTGRSFNPESTNDVPPLPTMKLMGGWIAQNEISIANMYFQQVFPSVDVERRLISPGNVKRLNLEAQRKRKTPFNIFANMLFPAIAKSSQKCARAQSSVDLARVACALERYRLANDSYPENLEKLEPKWISKLPHDIINGQPLKYRPTDNGRFALYSVGWNETDDGGKMALTSGKKNADSDKGDWVWPWPVD